MNTKIDNVIDEKGLTTAGVYKVGFDMSIITPSAPSLWKGQFNFRLLVDLNPLLCNTAFKNERLQELNESHYR